MKTYGGRVVACLLDDEHVIYDDRRFVDEVASLEGGFELRDGERSRSHRNRGSNLGKCERGCWLGVAVGVVQGNGSEWVIFNSHFLP